MLRCLKPRANTSSVGGKSSNERFSADSNLYQVPLNLCSSSLFSTAPPGRSTSLIQDKLFIVSKLWQPVVFCTCRILPYLSDPPGRIRQVQNTTGCHKSETYGRTQICLEFSRMGGVLRRRESIFLLCVDLLFVEASVDLLFVEASTRCVEASTRCETCCLLLYRVIAASQRWLRQL